MTSELKYLGVSVQNLKVTKHKKTQAHITSEKLINYVKRFSNLLQIGLHASLLHAQHRSRFENKQVSKQFSLYAKRTTQFLDQNYLIITYTYNIVIAKQTVTVLYSIRTWYA